MPIVVTDVNAGSNIYLIFNNYFFVDDDLYEMADYHVIANDEFRVVKKPAACNVDLSENSQTITNIDFRVTGDKGRHPYVPMPASPDTASSQSWLAVENRHQPPKKPLQCAMETVEAPVKRLQESGLWQVGAHELEERIFQICINRSFAPAYL